GDGGRRGVPAVGGARRRDRAGGAQGDGVQSGAPAPHHPRAGHGRVVLASHGRRVQGGAARGGGGGPALSHARHRGGDARARPRAGAGGGGGGPAGDRHGA